MALVGTTASKVSYDSLCQWLDDDRYYELYEGEAVVVPTPSVRHQRVAGALLYTLAPLADRTTGVVLCRPLDVVITQFDVVQPDVLYFGPECRRRIDPDRPVQVPPDLAVEVLSPVTEAIDRGRKMQLLARFGVPEYWLVDPYEHTVEVYRLTDGAYQLAQRAAEGDIVHAATLAGLQFPCAQIFADI